MSHTPTGGGTPISSPTTPPARRLSNLSRTRHHRSDSSASQALMASAPPTPGVPGTPPPGPGFGDVERRGSRRSRSGSESAFGTRSRPVSTFLETEQDMADLTAEMALLDDGVDSRTGKTLTGGLRPLSLLQARPSSSSDDHDDHRSAGSPRAHRSSSRASRPIFYTTSGAALSTSTFSHLEKDLGRVKKYTLFTKFTYRLRFVLRLLSLMGAGCVLGVVSHLTATFVSTKNSTFNGQPVWPAEGIDIRPTNLLMAGAAICILMELTWTIGSAHSGVRRLDSGVHAWVRWAAAITAWIMVGIWIAALVWCGRVKRRGGRRSGGHQTLFYVCQAKNMPQFMSNSAEAEPPVDFSLHCTEIRAGWFAAISVTTVNILIFVTILMGLAQRWWSNRRKGKGRAYDEEERRWGWRRSK